MVPHKTVPDRLVQDNRILAVGIQVPDFGIQIPGVGNQAVHAYPVAASADAVQRSLRPMRRIYRKKFRPGLRCRKLHSSYIRPPRTYVSNYVESIILTLVCQCYVRIPT